MSKNVESARKAVRTFYAAWPQYGMRIVNSALNTGSANDVWCQKVFDQDEPERKELIARFAEHCRLVPLSVSHGTTSITSRRGYQILYACHDRLPVMGVFVWSGGCTVPSMRVCVQSV
jgi:aspartate/tyrosine/aromatic aminotransferase